MTQRPSIRLAALAACSSSALMLSACATTPVELGETETLTLGRNAAGEPCTANRSWNDAALQGMFNASFAITCRNVSASRAQGFIRVIQDDPAAIAAIEATLKCGPASPADLPGVGAVQARRCLDSTLGTETAVITAVKDGATVIGSAARSVSGPLERGIRALLDGGSETDAAAIDFAGLASPNGSAQDEDTADFDPALALRQGISLNHRGLHVEASRLLNDALSRLPADAPAATRAELSLEAGLADSNIRFTEASDEHFARANELIASAAGEQRTLLVRKRDTYRALDLLNRRQFRRALTALDQLVSARSTSQPLQDIAVLRAINQPARESRDLATSVAVPDIEVLHQLEIDTQAQWAKSAALNALGDVAGAEQALAQADAAFLPLSNERIKRGPVHWLNAKLERQRGRLAARRQDWPKAIASFDEAIESLTRGAIETGGQGTEPGIAEIRLERASVIAQQGGPAETIRAAYGEAVDALVASGASSSVTPAGMETYLNLLVDDAANAESSERYFRAVQAIGEPAVARQMSKIQQVVTADPEIGAKVRDRAEMEREITRLRYEIADTDPSQTATIGNLEEQRRTAQERLTILDTELAGNSRVNNSEDRPATVADIRAALRPGEAFLKITQLRTNAYGILITPEATQIYRLGAPARDLAALATRVRNSIDGRLDEGRLVPFDVAASYALFRLITGPTTDRILQASSVILDPAGPLERLPAGVLVTDRESVARYDAAAETNRFDYTGVSFLAAKSSVSTAVSPRSFLVARSLPPSRAANPFIGFAEHQVPEASAAGAADVAVGNVCLVDPAVLRALSAQANPISREEIEIAARAIGSQSTPLVTGSAFTDTAVQAMTDLSNYKVLHFATHGLEEGVWGCPKSPPALVTSFGDANSDGLLSFDEIAGLRLDANLVVLSACDTGAGIRSQELARRSGQEEAGSTLQGLVRAFLTANARAVLATHWEVPAKDGTQELIETFYTAANTSDIGSSLQAAQRRLMGEAEFSHPFYWGAYFVVGDSSKSALGQPVQVAGDSLRGVSSGRR